MSNSSASEVNGSNNPDYSPFETLRENSKKFDQWLERNLMTMSESFSENQKKQAQVWEKARAPKIRWSEDSDDNDDDDDDFDDVPDIFKRQDRKDRNQSRSGRSRYGWIIAALLLLVLAFALPASFFHAELSGLAKSVIAGFDKPAGNREGPEQLASAEFLEARKALRAAMQGQAVQTTPLETAPETKAASTPTAPAAANTRSSEESRNILQQTEMLRKTSAAKKPQVSGAVDQKRTSPALNVQPPELAAASEGTVPAGATAPLPANTSKNVASSSLPEMIAIPGGDYQVPLMRGAHVLDASANTRLKPFQIARYEVTRGDWLECAARSACTTDAFERDFFAKENLDLPMTAITMAQTRDYIAWLNDTRPSDTPEFRLPTDTEWVVAARGATRNNKQYPWGDTFDAERIGEEFDLLPVTEAPALNGLWGIVGNVEERTADCWTAQTGPDRCYRGLGVVRGAPSGTADNRTAALTYRTSRSVDAPYSTVGFRLAR